MSAKQEENTIDSPKEPKAQVQVDQNYWSLFRLIGLFAFITMLAIPYIYNAHQSEKKIRQRDKVLNEIEELRSEYITLKSDVVGQNKQSDLSQKLITRQLEELSEAPIDLNTKDER
jgi:cell division protein FtsL